MSRYGAAVPALTLTDRGPILAAPWRTGSLAPGAGASYYVSHTVFRYDRWRDLPKIGLDAEKAARLWSRQPGSVWLMQWFHPGRRLMGDLSVWRAEQDLLDFLVLPEHTALVSHWRDRMHGTHHHWTGAADRAEIWRHAKALIS